MAKQKIPVESEPEANEDPKLIAKVDKMMDPKAGLLAATDSEDEKQTKDEPQEDLPPLDIFADAPGAPLLEKNKKGKKIAVSSDESSPPKKLTIKTKSSIEKEVDPLTEPESVSVDPPRTENYDDPKTAAAIEDIVAHEGDTALAVADQRLAAEQGAEVKEKKHGHKIFWSFIALICLLAAVTLIFVLDPSLHNPLSKLHWSRIRRHL